MNKSKLHGWKLIGSDHTDSIKCSGIAQPQTQAAADCTTISIQHRDEIESIIKINVNKYKGEIFSFSEYQETIAAIVTECGISDYRFIRTDFRLDSYDPDFYESYAKLNLYIIAALSLTYGIKNNYITNDMFSLRQKSQAAKGKDIEIENYNRAAKSKQTENHYEPAQSRLELRTMPREWRSIYLKAEEDASNMDLFKKSLMELWFQRLDAAATNFDHVQMYYNDNLEQLYRNKKLTKVRSLTDFIMRNENYIFTRKQLIDLYKRLDSEGDPVLRADNYKRRYNIEFFSKADMKAAIVEIKRAITEFFEK